MSRQPFVPPADIYTAHTRTAAALCHIAGDRTREQSSSCVPCEFRSSVSPVRSQRSCILLRSKALGPGPGWHRPSSLLCRTVPPFPAPPTAAKIVRAPCAPRAALLSILYHCPAALRIPLQWYAPGTYLVPLPPAHCNPPNAIGVWERSSAKNLLCRYYAVYLLLFCPSARSVCADPHLFSSPMTFSPCPDQSPPPGPPNRGPAVPFKFPLCPPPSRDTVAARVHLVPR